MIDFVQHGAQINACDLWQYTPIHEAASKSRIDVCTLLLSHGADPTLANCHGKTALDIAASRELRDKILRMFENDIRLNSNEYFR